MSVIQLRVSAQIKSPDGSMQQLPSADALFHRGPCVNVAIGISIAAAQPLLDQGLPVPTPVNGVALIDSGATTTCIDVDVARALGLPEIDKVQLSSASHPATQSAVYPINFEIIGTPIKFDVSRAVGVTLACQGLSLLIGRDVLRQCLLVYNGPNGDITIGM